MPTKKLKITADEFKVKLWLSSILYAEHMGDVQRAVGPLAKELGLPEPVWNENREYSDHEMVWPWDNYEEEG